MKIDLYFDTVIRFVLKGQTDNKSSIILGNDLVLNNALKKKVFDLGFTIFFSYKI